MSVDVQKMSEITTYVMMIWSAPYQMLMAIFFLFRLLGWPIFIGVLILIGVLPVNSILGKLIQKCQVSFEYKI